MRRRPLLLVLIGLLLAGPISSFVLQTHADTSYSSVTVTEAKTMFDTNPFLDVLDVRNQTEYEIGHIRNAKLIPVWELAARLNELNKTDEILVYRDAGDGSATASHILATNGFSHVYNMIGGIIDWAHEEYPVYVKYASIQEAINNATDGDTIYVSTGFYSEQLSVNKSIALMGENRSSTIIDATATALHVNADNVSINDFTIRYRGCACDGYCAVNITSSQNINVTNNVLVSDDFGIKVVKAREVIIAHNNITHTANACIVVLDSSEISVLENNITAFDGIEIDNSTESIFGGNTIYTNLAGIFTTDSHSNIFFSNYIFSSFTSGISISDSDNNTFFDNDISFLGAHGLFIWQSNNNSFFHNSFLAKGNQVSNNNSTNFWDNGFEGNFWNNYAGIDANPDGIGDTPQIIDSTNRDNFPLMGMFHSFDTSLDYDVDIVSNSTISDLEYIGPNSTIKLQVSSTNTNQTHGFCRVSIPHVLIDPSNGPIVVVIDDGQTPVLFMNNTLYDNGTHRWIYFTYPHSTHEILIVPEHLTSLIILSFMVATFMATMTYKRKHPGTWQSWDKKR